MVGQKSGWMSKRPCKWCGETTHTQFYCRLKRNKPLKVGKPLQSMGKIAKQWVITRETWLLRNPPDKHGMYICHICGDKIWHEAVTLDHIKSRSRHPELRFTMSNLAPAHWECNMDKGSKDMDEL